MNSLLELNNNSTVVEFNDQRAATVIFDRTIATNQTISANEGTNHVLPVGIEVLEIVNYQTSQPVYSVDVSDLPGTTVTWASIPTGLTLTQTSPGFYEITGMTTPSQWAIIRNPTVTPPSNYFGTFTYEARVTWNGVLYQAWTITANIIDITLFTLPITNTYNKGQTLKLITGNPQIQDPGNPGATYTITIVPNMVDVISAVQLGGAGGTATYNPVTYTITITGTLTQCNSRLSNIRLSFTANLSWNFYLTYSVNSSVSETDTVIQNFTESDVAYLDLTRSNDTFTLNSTTTLTGGPKITDYLSQGVYSLTIRPYVTNAVNTLSLTVSDSGYEYQTKYQTSNYLAELNGLRDYKRMDISNDGEWMVVGKNSGYQIGNPNHWTSRVYFARRNSANQYQEVNARTTPVAGYQTGLMTFMNGAGTSAIVVGSNPYLAVYYYKKISNTNWQYTSMPIEWGVGSSYSDIDVSKDGNTIAIGSANEDVSGIVDTGAVRIYKRVTDNNWPLETTLYLPGGNVASKFFGYRVSLSNDGNTLAVSTAASNGTNNVYVYTRAGTTWTLHSTLTQNYGGSQNTSTFGNNVKLSKDGAMLAIAAYDGSTNKYVYVYKLTTGVWNLFRTYGGKAGGIGSDPYALFGDSVDLSTNGQYMIVSRQSDSQEIIDIYNTTTNQLIKQFEVDPLNYALIGNVATTQDGKFITVNLSQTLVNGNFTYGDTVLCYGNMETSFNNTTKALTIKGSRPQINNIYDNTIVLVSGTGYNFTFEMLYEVTTPNAQFQSRNQRIVFIP